VSVPPPGAPAGPYEVVELSTVTDETIQAALNEKHAAGLRLDSMHFAMREGSRRPSMAFLIFVPGTEAGPPTPAVAPGDAAS
jgi:hypothetical protein